MNGPAREDDGQGEVFLDASSIIHEVTVDEEDLPDALRMKNPPTLKIWVSMRKLMTQMHTFAGHNPQKSG